MSELRPIPFAALVRRMRAELEAGGSVFGLERKDWYLPQAGLDLRHHHAGGVAGNPLGTAAGPHTQLAPNLVQGYLAGARVFELKTLQVLDRLSIPRPCIHAPHYALNVEWSQELSLDQSVREYLKAAWLLEILRRNRVGGAMPGHANLDFMLDLSVGYSLDGLQSPTLQAALDRLRHPAAGFSELRDELDEQQRVWAGAAPEGPVAHCITLSTFHGCPPSEIGSMASCLLDAGWDVVVKLNPTLLGLETVRDLLHGQLGYHHLEPDPHAFEQDLQVPAALELIARLQAHARAKGRTLGVKFTNTLVLKRDPARFTSDAGPHMYLSGLPLHPLALATAALVAEHCPQLPPLSFSAGVDRVNAAGLLHCGLAPLTLCTDLLRRGGQGRLSKVLGAVENALLKAGCVTLSQWRGEADASNLAAGAAVVRRLRQAAADAIQDPRHHAGQVMRPPRKSGQTLHRLDCINCDICLPVCPNGALFGWTASGDGERKTHQIGVLADACNACSNCETWCPEVGAPWRVKERWHQDVESLLASPVELDGTCLHARGLVVRFQGQLLCYTPSSAQGEDRLAALDEQLEVLPGAWPDHAALQRARLLWADLLHGADNPVALMWGPGQ